MPFENEKTPFYFTLKALFILKIYKFLSWLFGHEYKKGSIIKIRLISEFMTSQLLSELPQLQKLSH